MFSTCQMSLCCTSGPTLASAPTFWEGGHGCLSETTVMPSTCKVLNCSRTHACPVKKVGNSVRSTLTSPPFWLCSDSRCAAHAVQLMILNWKPVKSNSSDLPHCKHHWPNASIRLNLEVLFIEPAAPIWHLSTWSIPISLFFFHLCILFLLFLSSSGSRTSLYLGWDREWIHMGTHPELCRTGTWSLAGHQR